GPAPEPGYNPPLPPDTCRVSSARVPDLGRGRSSFLLPSADTGRTTSLPARSAPAPTRHDHTPHGAALAEEIPLARPRMPRPLLHTSCLGGGSGRARGGSRRGPGSAAGTAATFSPAPRPPRTGPAQGTPAPSSGRRCIAWASGLSPTGNRQRRAVV